VGSGVCFGHGFILFALVVGVGLSFGGCDVSYCAIYWFCFCLGFGFRLRFRRRVSVLILVVVLLSQFFFFRFGFSFSFGFMCWVWFGSVLVGKVETKIEPKTRLKSS
jgi:hypothetical protein